MYKLNLPKGQSVRIKDDRRTGVNIVLTSDKEYSQETLRRIYEAGFTTYITKTTKKKNNEEENNETDS